MLITCILKDISDDWRKLLSYSSRVVQTLFYCLDRHKSLNRLHIITGVFFETSRHDILMPLTKTSHSLDVRETECVE